MCHNHSSYTSSGVYLGFGLGRGMQSGGGVPPGGGGALPHWRWRGRAAEQGMIFTVIHIDTGYLNRPNWLLAGYSVYHRVASRASHRVPSPQCLWQARDLGTSDGACGTTMFMTGPRSRNQLRDGERGTQHIFYECIYDTQENRESVRTSTGYA